MRLAPRLELMRRLLLISGTTWLTVLLAACATTKPTAMPPIAAAAWDQRVVDLQRLASWQLSGRAAVAVGTQGWQASLDWRQSGEATEVHLSGPLGIGAMVLKRTPEGLSLNGAPPSDAVLTQLQDRLGFALPLEHLRYWLLGVPDPGSAFEFKPNDQDRLLQLSQDQWTLDFDRYMPVDGDVLPAHLVLSREGVRVRIVVDHWQEKP
jgi:outer membrane lipoprotein LolB